MCESNSYKGGIAAMDQAQVPWLRHRRSHLQRCEDEDVDQKGHGGVLEAQQLTCNTWSLKLGDEYCGGQVIPQDTTQATRQQAGTEYNYI